MSDYKVTVKGPGGKVVFEASAPLTESRSATYEGYNITHLPTTLWAYKNTSGRKWGISGKLVSRTPDEAQANASYLDLVRKWILPEFGRTGGTPPILKVYGYRHSNVDGRPVILESYNWSFPDDVDYIWQGGQAMPVIGLLSIELSEAYSAEEITAIDPWDITSSSGGSFVGGEDGKGSSAFWLDFGGAQPGAFAGVGENGLGSTLSSLTGVASLLTGVVTNPVATVGALTANLATSVLNSPEISEVTQQLNPIVSNPFVSGIGTTLSNPAQAASTITGILTPTAADPFSRSALPPPSIVSI